MFLCLSQIIFMIQDFVSYELIKEYRIYIDEHKLWLKARIVLVRPDERYEAQVSHYCKPFGAGAHHTVNSIHGDNVESVVNRLFNHFLPEFKTGSDIKAIDRYDDWILAVS